MFNLDDSSTVGINVAVGVAVIFAVIFVLGLLCGILGLVMFESGLVEAGHEAALWLSQFKVLVELV